jgi:hypothetical protein
MPDPDAPNGFDALRSFAAMATTRKVHGDLSHVNPAAGEPVKFEFSTGEYVPYAGDIQEVACGTLCRYSPALDRRT